jgi:hypothetical protein
MHIDSANHKFAAVGGEGLGLWVVKMLNTKQGVKFSLSETPIPRQQVTAMGQTCATMRPRTAHFLPLDESVLVTFVATDIAIAVSHL